MRDLKNDHLFGADFENMTDDEYRDFMREHLKFGREGFDAVLTMYSGEDVSICTNVRAALEWAEKNVETADRTTLEVMRRTLHLEYMNMADIADSHRNDDALAHGFPTQDTTVEEMTNKMLGMLPHDAALYCADVTIEFAERDKLSGNPSGYEDADIEALRERATALRAAIADGVPFAKEQKDLEDYLDDMTIRYLEKLDFGGDGGVGPSGLGFGGLDAVGKGRKPGSGGFLN